MGFGGVPLRPTHTSYDVIGSALSLPAALRSSNEAATMATVGRRLEGRVVIVTASTDGIGTGPPQICGHLAAQD